MQRSVGTLAEGIFVPEPEDLKVVKRRGLDNVRQPASVESAKSACFGVPFRGYDFSQGGFLLSAHNRWAHNSVVSESAWWRPHSTYSASAYAGRGTELLVSPSCWDIALLETWGVRKHSTKWALSLLSLILNQKQARGKGAEWDASPAYARSIFKELFKWTPRNAQLVFISHLNICCMVHCELLASLRRQLLVSLNRKACSLLLKWAKCTGE